MKKTDIRKIILWIGMAFSLVGCGQNGIGKPAVGEVAEDKEAKVYRVGADILPYSEETIYEQLFDLNNKIAIELVVDSFGMYSGKALEEITHTETPWQEARAYCLPQGRSNVIISKESIRNYFSKVAEQFQINSVSGLREYIDSRLGDV